MTQTERQLRAEVYELKAMVRDLTQQAVEWQEKAVEYETALTKIYREALKHAR